MTIQIPTVLILGAASSSHCGYPLGIDLISQIVQLHRQRKGISLPPPWTADDVDRFVTRLARSSHYSIDAYLESVPNETDLGKYLIAYLLKRLEVLDNLFPPNNSGWYQYLLNSLLGKRRANPFDGNNLSIITFNYDRTVEAYLYNALIARFGLSPDEALVQLLKVPIIHVHGLLGEFPSVPYSPSTDVDEVLAISKQINIIHEIKDNGGDFCTEGFAVANAKIMAAEKVIFLGFGFHYDNVRRLKVDWTMKHFNQVFSTFWDTSDEEYKRILARLSDLGITTELLPMRGGHSCDVFFRFAASLE